MPEPTRNKTTHSKVDERKELIAERRAIRAKINDRNQTLIRIEQGTEEGNVDKLVKANKADLAKIKKIKEQEFVITGNGNVR